MKKFLFLTLIFSAIISTTNAQAGPDPAALLQQTKEKQGPLMVEKTGLTADKVIEILFEMRMAASGLGNISEADRSAKLAELKAAKDKKISEIPLTEEQIQAVKTFYQEMGKNIPQKGGN